jgi:hypothetical protein
MAWARMEQNVIAYRTVAGKDEGKRPLVVNLGVDGSIIFK